MISSCLLQTRNLFLSFLSTESVTLLNTGCFIGLFIKTDWQEGDYYTESSLLSS